VRSPPRQKGNK
jgi:hypothetical protein